jgi:S-adenosylmethionine decarboxylase proenzyme
MSTPTLERAAPSLLDAGGVGKELIVEIWEPSGVDLTDKDKIRAILMRAVKSSGSTLIRSYFHRLHPGGITGFLLLKESHISIHTWPEFDYAALDFFTCGQADSYKALAEVEKAFQPKTVKVTEILRGARDPD